jgi:hypothetical protein
MIVIVRAVFFLPLQVKIIYPLPPCDSLLFLFLPTLVCTLPEFCSDITEFRKMTRRKVAESEIQFATGVLI